MELAEDMYKEELLEHYKKPQNYGKIRNCDAKYHDFNPVCGDEIEVYIKIRNGSVKDIKFTGKGCAISQAAASIATESVKGKKVEEVKGISNESMLQLLPIKVSNLRVKCALLALKAIQKAIIKYEGTKLQ
ncbi:SUF system NifU family Fe-S cluster assembly protein [Candidatus Woesearchaeota archaeon]|nr:SUF system NifU family Fe-S cluster assembly protein [Candidatus Woesearchaeota archaeon]